MRAMAPTDFPTRLPEVNVELIERGTSEVVTCDELRWWFVVPRAGETSAAAWYDRDTSALTAVRRTRRPVTPLATSPEEVLIDIEETVVEPGSFGGLERRDIAFTARLGRDRAEFLSVEQDGARTDIADPDFAANWGDTRTRTIREGGRLVAEGPRAFRTVATDGARVDLVDFSIDGRTRRCVRVLDLEPGTEPVEIGQAIIDLETGRTLAYLQYRPEGWDSDSECWLADHPEDGLTIDGVRYQRRNCTGRDEIALTDHALMSG